MRLALIDNYDSFTWNLVEILRQECPYAWELLPNRGLNASELMGYDKIIISPGPGLPEEWHLPVLILELAAHADILGICLGHQALALALGARLKQAGVYHGIQSRVFITDPDERLFQGLQTPVLVGRYHSWVVDENTLPDDLLVTSRSEDGLVMGLRHRRLPLRGLQFHPESYMTPQGAHMLRNWLL
ncbi:MAG: anthranilate synthase component II [Bacteroidales bacterium]